MFNINFADDWSQTADVWYPKQPLFQLSHNHFPITFSLTKLMTIMHIAFTRDNWLVNQWLQKFKCKSFSVNLA